MSGHSDVRNVLISEERAMIPPLDIFRVEQQGRLTWKACADNLPAAQHRIALFMVSEPGDYLIFSQDTGNKTLVSATSSQNPESPCASPD